jgi:exosortase/archaeosortase family protein
VGLPAYDPVTGEIMVPVLGSGISIILACTAIEAMVIFLGAFLTVEPRENPWKAYKKITPTMRSYQKMSGRERKARALVYTLVPIWVLNLVRNMAIIWLVNNTGMSFDVAHGYIGKGFSFLVLLALAMIVFDLVPEIYDDLLDLYHLGQPEKDKGRKGQEVEGSEGKKAKEEKDKKPEKKMKSKDEEE